jgi:hypothetical protein
LIRCDGSYRDGEVLDRPFDAEPAAIDRRDMIRVKVTEDNVVPITGHVRTDRAANRSGANDRELHVLSFIETGRSARGREIQCSRLK